MTDLFTTHGYQHDKGVSFRYVSGSTVNPQPKDILIGIDINIKLDQMDIAEIGGFIEAKLRRHFEKKNGKKRLFGIGPKIVKPKPGMLITQPINGSN